MVRILHGSFQLRVVTNAGEKNQCFDRRASAFIVLSAQVYGASKYLVELDPVILQEQV
jgi:hypothetical protein